MGRFRRRRRCPGGSTRLSAELCGYRHLGLRRVERGLGFRGWGLGFRGLGFRVLGLGFRGWGLRFRVKGLGSRVWGGLWCGRVVVG